MLEVQFVNQNRTIKTDKDETVRDVAIRNKLSIYAHVFKILNCRGRGLCRSCVIEVVSGNTSPRNETESQQLAHKLEKNPNLRLACQVKVIDNLVIKTHI